MPVEYTVESQRDAIRVDFTTLPDNPVFLRVERRPVGSAADPVTLDAPTLVLSFSVGQSLWSAALSWLNTPPVTVDVERRRNGGEWVVVSDDNASGGYTDTGSAGAAGNGVFEYRLNRNGRLSNVVRFARGDAPPRIGFSLAQRFSGTQVDVSLAWDNTPQINVNVERSLDGGAWSVVSRGNTSGSYVDTVGTTGSYRYRLVLANRFGEFVTVDPSSAPPPDPVLAQPTVTRVADVNRANAWRFSLSWQRAAGTTVSLQRQRNRNIVNSAWTTVAADTASTSFSEVVPAGSYEYRLLFNGVPHSNKVATTGARPQGLTAASRTIASNFWNRTFTWTTRGTMRLFWRRNGGEWETFNQSDTTSRTATLRGFNLRPVNVGSNVYGRFEVRIAPRLSRRANFNGFNASYGVPSEPIEFVEGAAPPTLSAISSSDGTTRTVSLSWDNAPPVTVDVQRNYNGESVDVGTRSQRYYSLWTTVSSDNATGSFNEEVPDTGIYSYQLLMPNPDIEFGREVGVGGKVAGVPVVLDAPGATTGGSTPEPEPEPIPPHPGVPVRTPITVREFTREEVTGMAADGEVFNLPRVPGLVSGADSDSDGRAWIIETRRIRTTVGDQTITTNATVILRYNPVSGQGWLFTAPDVANPIDVAATDREFFIAEGDTVNVYTKPTRVRDNAPNGVLQKTREFTLSGEPTGISAFGDILYANVDGEIVGYTADDGSLQGRFAGMPDPMGAATDYTISFGGAGLFAAVRGVGSPVSVWHYIPDAPGGAVWRVHQTGAERKLHALAALDTSVLIVDRDVGLVSPYRVFRHPLLDGYTDRAAPLGVEFEYRVGAQGYNMAYEQGVWVK